VPRLAKRPRPPAVRYGPLLRIARGYLRVPQTSIARAAGVSQVAYSDYERERLSLDADLALRLIEAMLRQSSYGRA
jgi:transcriptional regulator with XRE-family HTH domain